MTLKMKKPTIPNVHLAADICPKYQYIYNRIFFNSIHDVNTKYAKLKYLDLQKHSSIVCMHTLMPGGFYM